MSARAWDTVAPLLARNYDLLVPTAAGHRGGRRLDHASIGALTDVTEQLLDDRGLDTVHIAGNSMGGWMGIEARSQRPGPFGVRALARRFLGARRRSG